MKAPACVEGERRVFGRASMERESGEWLIEIREEEEGG